MLGLVHGRERLGASPPRAVRPDRQRAIAVADELGTLPLVARCRLGLGVLHARAGESAQARTELAAAGHLFSGMAMGFWWARVEAALDGVP
jgi:hypothetical protein